MGTLQWEISGWSGISQTTISQILTVISLMPKCMTFLSIKPEKTTIMMDFHAIEGFLNVTGAVECAHIAVKDKPFLRSVTGSVPRCWWRSFYNQGKLFTIYGVCVYRGGAFFMQMSVACRMSDVFPTSIKYSCADRCFKCQFVMHTGGWTHVLINDSMKFIRNTIFFFSPIV